MTHLFACKSMMRIRDCMPIKKKINEIFTFFKSFAFFITGRTIFRLKNHIFGLVKTIRYEDY